MNDSGMGLELELGIGSDTSLPMVDEAQLTDAIRGILQDADLEQLSRRMIRKQLEAQFHMDLSHYKDTINATILELIEQQNQQQGEDEDDEDDEGDDDDDDEPEPSDDDDERRRPPKKKAKKTAAASPAAKKKAPVKRKRAAPADGDKKSSSNAFNMELSLSPELASVVGSDSMARPQIVKALWEYIREHELQDPTNKRHIILDAKLRSVFQRDSVTMFSMNKYVKRHVRKPEDLPPNGWADIHRDGVSSDEDTEAKPAKKKAAPAKRKKKQPAAHDDDDENEDAAKPKRANPFNTELALSPELATVVGSDRMSRPQIVKALWNYIHAHELQDPADKRTIVLDDTLRQVFQRDSVTMFSMNKYIKRHARKPELVPAGGWAEIPRDGLSSDEDESKTPKKKKAKKGGKVKDEIKDE